MRATTLLAGLVALSGSATASSLPGATLDLASRLGRRSEHLHAHLRRDAAMVLRSVDRRDPQSGGEPVKSNDPAAALPTDPAHGPASELNLQKWAAETSKACNTAMRRLNGQASNPSGLAVCYNLPYLDRSKGVFQAELRVYNISAPTAPWDGVAPQDIDVGFSYLGALVHKMEPGMTRRHLGPDVRMAVAVERDDEARVETLDRRAAGAPKVLLVQMYVGQINENLIGPVSTDEDLRALLIPNIGLSAPNPDTGAELKTGLSSNEASFVNGVFSEASRPVTSASLASASSSASALAVTATPFVLPGTSLGIFPTGLVITAIWAAFFLAAVGFGTVGRVQFREQYRRRTKRANNVGVRTI